MFMLSAMLSQNIVVVLLHIIQSAFAKRAYSGYITTRIWMVSIFDLVIVMKILISLSIDFHLKLLEILDDLKCFDIPRKTKGSCH